MISARTGATLDARDELAAIWPDVELYLDRIIPIAARSHGTKEGAVQAAVAAHRSRDRVVLDREVTPSFRDRRTRRRSWRTASEPILDALAKANLGFGRVPKKLGNECDALAVDERRSLLAVEVKPLGCRHRSPGSPPKRPCTPASCRAGSTATPPRRRLIREVLRGHAGQRHVVAPAPPLDVALPESLRVTPVVALQRGASPEMVRRMLRGA